VEIITDIKKSFPCHQHQGDTAITIPPFFKDAGIGKERIWGEDTETPQPMTINWPGLNDKEKAELIPTLSTTDNWILLTHPLGTWKKYQPPFKELQRIARAEGECSRHKGWWCEGKNTHSITTEVWINARGQIPEATRMAIQEALEEENTKYTPSFGTEDLEVIHRSGSEAGLLGIYNFPGAVYATDGSNDRGIMGVGYF